MRTLLKITIDMNAGNKAIKDGSLGKTLENLKNQIKPEAEYYVTSEGTRAAYYFFDLKDPSDIPFLAEPLFLTLNARVEFSPAMNGEDLKKGLEKWMKSAKSELAYA
ncbi:MAG: hypothetical protein DWQ44_09210 [Bacteroidetes bacterium]|nr:MAG: hypothetical protein DWQ33_02565 [Bacteroidota bacterium]REK06668.1 MAG: hypothetical protein DWQ39_03000 [Bacteroidota bacterium]REK33434.1 MAG: hypothetical protein DWQ44_09210 [Bacteroidota bacterium]REK47116.1 MAG: hypothetical protein DWQ48_13545 [Bacteroidota bacterium]